LRDHRRFVAYPLEPWHGRRCDEADCHAHGRRGGDLYDHGIARLSCHFLFVAVAAIGESLGMKSLREELWFEVPGRRGFVNITRTVEDLVRKSGVREGLCLVNAMHITASVFINDAEQGLLHDYEIWLEKLAPHAPTSQYDHNRTGEDNADAHLKRQVMGREVVVAITNGKLDFGPWEQIFYGEFDGKRRKRALVKIIGE
jgi:secondary thiamine-phosphate synthase enzyme